MLPYENIENRMYKTDKLGMVFEIQESFNSFKLDINLWHLHFFADYEFLIIELNLFRTRTN